jgi:hypothetical protein
MKKFMYLAKGSGADLSGEAYACDANDVAAIKPESVTSTVLYVNRSDVSKDRIEFTHDDTTTTTGHRCREIAKAFAEAANAGPHVNGMTDIVDLDNSTFYSGLSFITAVDIILNY